MRIQKYCSENGICSRREAEALILSGKVRINGVKVTTLGMQIDPEKDTVAIEGVRERSTYIANKPPQLAMDDFAPLPEGEKIQAVSPLDKKNEGLVVYSNDQRVVTALTKDSAIARTFIVTMRDTLPPTKVNFLEKTLRSIDSDTSLTQESERAIRLSTGKPKKADIRALAEHAHTTVETMKCISVGGIKLGTLRPGMCKKLVESEINKLIN